MAVVVLAVAALFETMVCIWKDANANRRGEGHDGGLVRVEASHNIGGGGGGVTAKVTMQVISQVQEEVVVV